LTLAGRIPNFRLEEALPRPCGIRASKGEEQMANAVSDNTFEQEVLKSTEPVLVDFFAEWCGPCKAMAPALEQVAKEMQGKVKIVKLDVDQNPGATGKYGIRATARLPRSTPARSCRRRSSRTGSTPRSPDAHTHWIWERPRTCGAFSFTRTGIETGLGCLDSFPRGHDMRAPAATRRLTLTGIAFALLGSGTAWAPGTIALDEVMDQLKAEPKLIAEIEAELKAQKIAADSVI